MTTDRMAKVKEAVERFIAIRNEEYYPLEKELNVLMSLACSYIAGEIGEYATEEDIANTISFCLESGQWHLVSTLVNSGDVVDIAKALVNKIPRQEYERCKIPNCECGGDAIIPRREVE